MHLGIRVSLGSIQKAISNQILERAMFARKAYHIGATIQALSSSLRAIRGRYQRITFSSSIQCYYASMIVKTPTMADSITEGVLATWEKKVGDSVARDEIVASIETDKITLPVNSPESGVVLELFAKEGDTVVVGSDLFKLDVGAESPTKTEEIAHKKEEKKEKTKKKAIEETPSVEKHTPIKEEKISESAHKQTKPSTPIPPPTHSTERNETRVKMTPMRQRISQRLKESQENAASLTTFNEVDMSALVELRTQYKEDILKKHGVKFGFMSAFVKGCASVLTELPMVNSRIEGSEIVTPNYVDISVAVATPKGLVTPVLKDCHTMSMIQIEQNLFQLGEKARAGSLSMNELSGGTFTISNGGIFGSLMGTPIINLPQSAILGMHTIKDRPIAMNGQVVIRPMMYLALTYDHRIIDGREAVTFLVRLKALLEDPRRFLLNL